MGRALLASLMLAGLLLVGPLPTALGPAPAPAAGADKEDPAELAREGMERMMRALTLLIEMIPIYEMPEVLENGDILIRRKNPIDSGHGEEPEVDKTKT